MKTEYYLAVRHSNGTKIDLHYGLDRLGYRMIVRAMKSILTYEQKKGVKLFVRKVK